MREIDKVRSLSAEELVKYFGVDCSRCGKCNSDEEADKKTYDDCVKGNIEFFNEPHSLEDLGYECRVNVWSDKCYLKKLDDNRFIYLDVHYYNDTCKKYEVVDDKQQPLCLELCELKIILKMFGC